MVADASDLLAFGSARQAGRVRTELHPLPDAMAQTGQQWSGSKVANPKLPVPTATLDANRAGD